MIQTYDKNKKDLEFICNSVRLNLQHEVNNYKPQKAITCSKVKTWDATAQIISKSSNAISEAKQKRYV